MGCNTGPVASGGTVIVFGGGLAMAGADVMVVVDGAAVEAFVRELPWCARAKPAGHYARGHCDSARHRGPGKFHACGGLSFVVVLT
jgi:hypothetical protein